MADSSKLNPAQRKTAKRASRRSLKDRIKKLSPKQQKELRKFEGTTTEFFRSMDEKTEE